MKTLVLCRHAKSDWETGLPDFERPLNSRGKKDLARMAELMKTNAFSPGLIVSSPAVRAATTAKEIWQATGCRQPIRFEKSIYEEGAGALFSLLQSMPEEHTTLMVFGHNPTLEQAAQFLLQSRGSVVMPTSAMVAMEFAGTWKNLTPGHCHLKWMLIPRLLRSEGFNTESD